MNQVATNKFADLSAPQQLRRLINSFMLFPNVTANENLLTQVRSILSLCTPEEVRLTVVDMRERLALRKPPLLLISEMFKLSQRLGPEWSKEASEALMGICGRPDDITEVVNYYWGEKKSGEKTPLPNQLKKAVKTLFHKFDEYQLGKYQSGTNGISLRDIMFLCHVKPNNAYSGKWVASDRKKVLEKVRVNRSSPLSKEEYLQYRLAENLLDIPATRETLLSEAKSEEEKTRAYLALMANNKLPALAFLKNLNAMHALRIPLQTVSAYGESLDLSRVSVQDLMMAVNSAPNHFELLSKMFLNRVRSLPKLPGRTIFVADISGSMNSSDIKIGAGTTTRMAAMHMLLAAAMECCEDIAVYATSGNDATGKHATRLIEVKDRGLDLFKTCELGKLQGLNRFGSSQDSPLGCGGIFTRQALEYIRTCENNPERIIVVSDSQDCDRRNKVPSPFGKRNYLINIGTGSQGINYAGVWTDEINGWAPNFIDYIAECEKEI